LRIAQERNWGDLRAQSNSPRPLKEGVPMARTRADVARPRSRFDAPR